MSPSPEQDAPLVVIARMRAKPGQEGRLRAALDRLVTATRAEEGCLAYDLHVGVDDPQLFSFYEQWTSRAAHDAHDGAPHVAAFREQAAELLDGAPQVDRLAPAT